MEWLGICGGGYMNLRMWKNCVELNKHTRANKMRTSEKDQWIISMAISWLGYCIVVLQDVTFGGNWTKGYTRSCTPGFDKNFN